ncbi:MAG: methyl-accepting chemotaxis protein [Clostridia bacterium]|nr:methyl-accepting chemotaxis protein [Clostridia bacterium]
MRIDLKKKILSVAVLPVLLLGIVTIVITLTQVKSSLISEVKDSLSGTAATTLAAYNQHSGSYLRADNGDVWKGGYNISKSESLLDNIKEESGMDVTFFYENERIMTSAKDRDGNRILGSPAGEKIVEKVLKGGENYFSSSVSLDGTLNYGYYIPVYQKGTDSEPIGMIFAGVDKQAKDNTINGIILMVLLSVIFVMVACIVIAVIMSVSITRSLRKGISKVQKVADGELGSPIEEKLLKRNDEVGDLAKAIDTLQKALQNIVSKIAQSTDNIKMAANELGVTAKDTNYTMKQVEDAVSSISENITEQAKSTKITTDNIVLMGDQIGRTSEEVGLLNQNADVMRKSSEQASYTIQQLRQINDKVKESINTITRQTNLTNESAQKIQAAIGIISSIAEETNLLSLNASIEAARAGESGRGFAVVASQIQKLAEQSNSSSCEIEEITNTLISNSDEAVEIMRQVHEIIDSQSQNMSDTENIVSEVMDGINTSLEKIEKIEYATEQLESSRNRIVETVEGLSDIAEQNAASTEETFAQTSQVSNTFEQIEAKADQLKQIADELSDIMQHFQL